jgi:hypothetical protein
MRLARHVANMEDMRDTDTCGKVTTWKPRRRWEDNIKMILKKWGETGQGIEVSG